jgi:peptidyl-prolyl cis-trans isomerase B (cyclophilin B)
MRRALIAAAAALALAGCGGSSSGGGGAAQVKPGSGASTTPAATNANGCTTVATPHSNPQQFSAEPKVTTAAESYTATIVTNCGTIVATLDGKHAPHTVNSFSFLAGKGFFDNTICHRLTTSGIFVLQCGDPTGTGSGGPGYTIPDENLGGDPRKVVSYPAGTIAMANAGPNTGGSQFFLVYKDTRLPDAYPQFGTITKGLDILRHIAAAGSNPPGDGSPVQPVVIESFTVAKG